MAAAEYYNPGSTAPRPPQAPMSGPQGPPRPQNLGPPPNGPPPNLQAPPYPISDAPPPYSPMGQRPQSQPPPGQRIPQPNYTAYNANPNPPHVSFDTHQYPPEKPQRPSTLQNMYRPSDFTSSHPPPAAQNGYGPTTVAPGLSQVYGNNNQAPGRRYSGSYTQSPNRPPGRSRSSSRERRKYHSRPSSTQKKKGSGVDTFLGAGGGAIIGDLIFPGLGTLGGAILGGVGGHEYGKNKRAHSNPSNRGLAPPNSYRRSASNSREYYEDDYRGRKY